MILAKFIARQLRKPSGFFGKYFLTHMLNRSNKAMNDQVLHLLQVQQDDRILEIGFGGGDLLTRMAQNIGDGLITGIDFSSDVIDIGEKRFQPLLDAGKLEIHHADAGSLPFDANSFNKVCTVNTIYFWPDVEQVLQELLRVLQSKGLIIISLTTRESMNKLGEITRHGFIKYSAEDIKQLLGKVGFINVRIIFGKNNHGEFICAAGEKF
jgi:ubiquinone/menaquinone biosynthesis C-methylase UbiE